MGASSLRLVVRVRKPTYNPVYDMSRSSSSQTHPYIDLRKARERELATFDEKSTSSGIAEPYAR